MKKFFLSSLLFSAFAAFSTDMTVSVEIPEINSAEYHLPYIAIWIEDSDKQLHEHLAVWYQEGNSKDNHEGEEWLKDLRRWWRKGGREATMPLDGVSGATKAVGQHALTFNADSEVMKKLVDGNYTLLVEASREHGGREVVKIPFTLPVQDAQAFTGEGKTELGAINVQLLP